MKIEILAVGKNMPTWVNQGVAEYLKRFPPHLACSLTEITPAKRSKNSAAEQYKQQEGQAILANIPPANCAIALDVTGRPFSTEELARQLQKWMDNGRNLSLLIGGPDGLAAPCLERAEMHWSLSALTFPHPLVRIILVEQLYRAWSILNNHPYHRE